jgi:FkbM family methyltransferase
MTRVIDAIRWRYPRFIARRHDARGVSRAVLYVLAGISFRGMVSGPGDRARLLGVVTQLIAAELAGRDHGRLHRINVSYRGRRLPVYVDRLNDLDVLHEVFVEKQYDDLELSEPPATILDLGAHIGAALLALHVRFPQAQLNAAEADPATFRRLRRNLAALPQARAVQAAVGEHDGTVEFLPARDGWVSGLREMAGGSGDGADEDVVAVRSVRFDTLLDELGVERADLVKVDIEGAEWPLVNSLDPARMGTMIMEWHADLHGHEPDELVALLPGHHVLAEALPSPRRFIVTAWPR